MRTNDKIPNQFVDFPRELEHDIISMLNLGGIQPEETSSVLEEDYGDEEDDEYEPNDCDDDVVSFELSFFPDLL